VHIHNKRPIYDAKAEEKKDSNRKVFRFKAQSAISVRRWAEFWSGERLTQHGGIVKLLPNHVKRGASMHPGFLLRQTLRNLHSLGIFLSPNRQIVLKSVRDHFPTSPDTFQI
jgi:hypothetical protein